MASVQQIDWVAIKMEAQKAVTRAEAALAHTETQLAAFSQMPKAWKKYQQRAVRQRQQLEEARAVLAEVSKAR